jgi:hypothetical protein
MPSAIARLEQRQGADARPVREARQEARLLLGAPRLGEDAGGEGRREQRRGEEAAPRLLEQHHEIDEAEPGAAVGLGDGEAEPAELGELLPGVGRVAPLGLHQLAHGVHGTALVEELAHLGAQ